MTTSIYQIPAPPVVIEPGGGDLIHMGALAVFFKVVSAQVGGACELHEQPIPPGTLVAPHTHDRQDQVSYVLEGTLGFRVGFADVEVPAGGAIFRPRGVPHAVWNAGPGRPGCWSSARRAARSRPSSGSSTSSARPARSPPRRSPSWPARTGSATTWT